MKEVLKQNKNNMNNCFIFLDKDIYIHNPNQNTPSNEFAHLYYFNTYCFEDFLVLHLDESIINSWHLDSFNVQKKYFNNPDADTTTEISKLLVSKKVFAEYKKGELPPNFEFSLKMLNRLVKNCKDEAIHFKSDFVTKIVVPQVEPKIEEANKQKAWIHVEFIP